MTLEEMMIVAQAALVQRGELKPGHYAVEGKRYYLDIPDKGRWKGYLFLSTGSDYHSRRRLVMRQPDGTPMYESKHGTEILAAILAAPIKHMREYGEITGSCAICGRKLEDPASVELGIGPVCLGRLL